MMRSIYECSREERLERALLVIEGLVLNLDHYGEKNAEGNYILNEMGYIYSISHAASGRCCSKTGGLEYIEQFERDFKTAKIYDIEKQLAKPVKEFKRELECSDNRDGSAILSDGLSK